MTPKHKRVITQLKIHKLYPTYRALLNVYLNRVDKNKLTKYLLARDFLKFIREENIPELIKYLTNHKAKTPKLPYQVENFKKFYLYKTKCNI